MQPSAHTLLITAPPPNEPAMHNDLWAMTQSLSLGLPVCEEEIGHTGELTGVVGHQRAAVG